MTTAPTKQPKQKLEELFERNLAPIRYHAVKLQDKAALWAQGKREGTGLGFNTLDDKVRLVNGQLTTVAARPGMGKTSFALQVAANVGRTFAEEGKGKVTAIFSAEMTGWSLAARMAAARAGVPLHTLQMGKATPDEYERFSKSVTDLYEMPIWIDDSTAPTTESMFRKLDEMAVPVGCMIFDFLELGGDRTEGNEERRISKITIALRDIAKSLDIPVIALSQLSRKVEDRNNKMPTLADLRYSGQIEQSSDVVLFLMTPEYYVIRGDTIDCKPEDREGVTLINMAKNRNGPVGIARLAWRKEAMEFADLHRD